MQNTIGTPEFPDAATLAQGNTLSVKLPDGLTVGSSIYRFAVLRQLSAGDVQEASEAAERLVVTGTGDLALVSSPARMGAEMLRRQVARLEGDSGHKFDGPLEPADMARLTVADLRALQIGAAMLDAQVEKAVEAMGKRGRSAAGSPAHHADGAASDQHS